MKLFLTTLCALVSATALHAAGTSAVAFTVDEGGGAKKHYLIEPPAGASSGKPTKDAGGFTFNVTPKAAELAAVEWAGGKQDAKGSYPGAIVDVGAGKPGGFYNAANVKPEGTEQRGDYYVVKLSGVVGGARQPLYAVVQTDGKIVKPVEGVAEPERPAHKRSKHHAKG